ncbi:MAG: heavy-metal-associated domain-containing protein [Patescibacteria group bacterium]
MKVAKIALPTIHCESCVKLIEMTLKPMKGVTERKYDIAGRSVEMRFDDRAVTANEIVEAIKNDAGYEASLESEENEEDDLAGNVEPQLESSAIET